MVTRYDALGAAINFIEDARQSTWAEDWPNSDFYEEVTNVLGKMQQSVAPRCKIIAVPEGG